MQPINEISGFPPVATEMEDLRRELQDAFRHLRPALAGACAYCTIMLTCTYLLK